MTLANSTIGTNTGTTIGPYRIADEIGRGSVAVVYRAHDTLYDRPVALKVLPPYFAHDPAFVRHFVSAGRDAARLRHAGIVRVYDAGQADGQTYVAMELVEGRTLAQILDEQSGPLIPADVLRVVEQVAAALDYAHAQGVVHRALKPSNLFITADADVLVSDFEQPGRPDGYPVGSPAYWSPEQARGGAELDARSDIYSLAAVAYRLYSGRSPFSAANTLALLRQIIEDAPPLADSLNPTLPAHVGRALNRGLAKDPALRFASAGALHQALAQARPPAPRAEAPAEPAPQPAPPPAPPPAEPAPLVEQPAADTLPAAAVYTIPHIPPAPAVRLSDLRKARRRPSPAVLLIAGLAATAVLLLLALALRSAGALLAPIGDRTVLPAAGASPTAEAVTAAPTPAQPPPSPAAEQSGGAQIAAPPDGSGAPAPAAEAAAASPAPQLVAAPLTVYTDAEGRFQIQAPQDWAVQTGAGTVAFVAPDVIARVFIEPLTGLPPAEAPELMIARYLDNARDLQSVELLAGASQQVGRLRAYEQPFTATFAGAPVTGRLVAISGEGQGAVLGVLAESGRAPSFASIFEAVLSSFLLGGAPAQPPVAVAAPDVAAPAPAAAQPDTVFVAAELPAEMSPIEALPAEALPVETPPAEAAEPAAAGPLPGGRIAFARWNEQTSRMDLHIYHIPDGYVTNLIPFKRQPDFGQLNALAANSAGGDVDNIVRMGPGGEAPAVISDYAEDGHPHWSPDGEMLVFDSTQVGDGRSRIYVLADADTRDNPPPLTYGSTELFGRYPIFLANGRIAYNGCDVWKGGTNCGIQVVDPYGGEPSTITGWLRDLPTDNLGARILFMTDREGNWDVYSVNPDGSDLLRLTDAPGNDGLATASPDGSHIAFVSDRDGAWAVYTMQPDGSEQRKLFDLEGGYGGGEWDWLEERISWGL